MHKMRKARILGLFVPEKPRLEGFFKYYDTPKEEGKCRFLKLVLRTDLVPEKKN